LVGDLLQNICYQIVYRQDHIFFWAQAFLKEIAMLSKNSKGYNAAALPPAKRLRANLGDLFLSGHVSGLRGKGLFADAEAAGAEACEGLGAGTASRWSAGHAHRDLLRRLKKGNQWPPQYKTEIRVKNAKTDQARQLKITRQIPEKISFEGGLLRNHIH
jgi:hypothetical protein